MTETDAARRRSIIDAFDSVLDLSARERAAWLRAHHPGDAELVTAIDALLAADAAPTIMPSRLNAVVELIPPERIGSYRLVSRIGSGGMGEVWIGERADGLFDHRVAIKLMRPALVSADLESFFDSERRLLARLRHPNIARLFDGGVTADGIGWFAMDLIDGVTLDEWLRTLGPVSGARADLERRVRVAAAVADAVQYAHRNLIVHADLKPQNILIEAGDVPRLVDFGIAHLVATENIVGGDYPRTPAYASPERLAGSPPSVLDDVFALGRLLDLMLDGATSDDLRAVVARACAAERETRYETADALAGDLRAWLAHRPVAARAGGWRYVAGRFVRRNRLVVAAASLVLLSLLATTLIVTTLYYRAEAARSDAEQRFAEVRGLARYMLVDFHDALEPLAGSQALRARTADVGRSYLARLSGRGTDDADLLKELAVGFGRVGHTMAVSATNGTRGMEAGDRSLARAEAILSRLVARYPARGDLKVELARVLTWRSSVMAYARSDVPGAHRLLDRAFALDDAVLARAPGDIDAAYGRWLAVVGRLDIWSLQEDWRAIAQLAAAQEAHVRTLPVPPRYRALRPLLDAAQHNAWGDALDYLGEPAAAQAHYAAAYSTLERALPASRSDVRIRTRMIGYAYQLSTVFEELKQPARALAWADRGVTQARMLRQFEQSPSVLAMSNLVTLQHARLLIAAGRKTEAIAEARASVDERRRSALAEPTSDDARSSYLFAMRVLSDLYDLAGRSAEACRTARRASAGWTAMYPGRTPPEKQAGDMKRLAERIRTCRSPART